MDPVYPRFLFEILMLHIEQIYALKPEAMNVLSYDVINYTIYAKYFTTFLDICDCLDMFGSVLQINCNLLLDKHKKIVLPNYQ